MTGSVVRAWRPAVPGVTEAFHAHVVDYAYPVHCHDEWTLLVVDQGAIRYDLDGRDRGAEPATVTLLPPHVVHDGRPAASAFRTRVLYLDADVLPTCAIGACVDRSTHHDATLRRAVDAVHDALVDDDLLAAEVHLVGAVERLQAHLARREPTAVRPESQVARQLRDYLDAEVSGAPTLRAAAAVVGRHPTHLARSFRATFGLAPHAYVTARRVDRARRLLVDGMAPAEVAVAVGFHDQAHLTRVFRRHVGTTPARFAAPRP